MEHATPADRDYFERIGRLNRSLPEEGPPRSLAEMFARLEAMRRTLGALATPGLATPDPRGDLDGHLAFLAHLRRVLAHRGHSGAR